MTVNHVYARMTGRDPHERHRAATPLELLFDLVFVVAFSQIGSQVAHYLELGHLSTALLGGWFATFAVAWAWINYSWLASAYDTDDVFFRIATMVVMIGVIVVALGVPDVFHSIDDGVYLNNGVMVAGYVIMRIATITLWLRVARDDPKGRKTAIAYAVNISIAQVGWIALIFLNLPVGLTIAVATFLQLFELAGPLFAEMRFGRTPWHPHHIAERYGLLVIITLGEVILGTILAISAIVEHQGWSVETGAVAFGGVALAFGMWWVYFSIPWGAVLERHRDRAWAWGYLQIFVFGSLVAVGAGLHVAAYVIEGVAHVDATFAALSIAIPVLLYETLLFVLYSLLLLQVDTFHVWLYLGVIAVLALGVAAVALGASLAVGILIIACSPVVVVVGYETVGWRHGQEMLARALRD
ncbi:low temperature requirement protein A [Microbacterium sp. 4R-513]|uniref:low temperature requirement protein A n=1 Tax=Microbacterium sp. 4R-513 TaxID=2567934 RepID=UPI0013E14180|nr:low temperature requirement protein A [Microbacterium sp. 4R-513]QIG38174.1 low temperature requirement protein A [Microbacterium sp. 4R-513]